VAADQATRWAPKGIMGHLLRRVVTVAVLSVLALMTIVRNMDWKDDLALFSRAVQRYPDNAANHAGLGHAYLNEDNQNPVNLDLAEAELGKAVALNPRTFGVHTRLGYIRLAKGDSQGALSYYTTALAIYPTDKEALLNRAIALENLGRSAEALADFRRFLTLPGYELADARPYVEERIRALLAASAPKEGARK